VCEVFRRRRQAGEDQMSQGRIDAALEDVDELDEQEDDVAGDAVYSAERAPGGGPWDSAERYPQRQRVDLGSLLIPVNPDQEVQLNVAGEQIVAASVITGDSTLQVQAFAAPKSGDLWDDVRGEIAEEIGKVGGDSQEVRGPFGTELHARVPAEPDSGLTGLQPARYIGVDGPRWLLRGTIGGQAATHAEPAAPLEEAFADIVVVRGDHPAPPRDLLEIRLPDEMRQAIEAEIAQAEQRGQYPSPFERGPEITETR
jgi:Protein of unknown function (DUF3710)